MKKNTRIGISLLLLILLAGFLNPVTAITYSYSAVTTIPTTTLPCPLKGDKYPCDGSVNDFEILSYIDEWANGLVEGFDLRTAIDNWAKSPPKILGLIIDNTGRLIIDNTEKYGFKIVKENTSDDGEVFRLYGAKAEDNWVEFLIDTNYPTYSLLPYYNIGFIEDTLHYKLARIPSDL